MKARSRILIVTRNFPPLMGGMEKLNWHLSEELAQRTEVRVIAPRGARNHAPPQVQVIEVPLRPLWLFLISASWKALKESIFFRPSVILAGSGLTAPFCLIAASITKARAIAYLHGLDLAITHPVYRSLWLPAIRRLDKVIVNSHATAQLAHKLGVSPERATIVFPGVKLPALSVEERQRLRNDFRIEHGLRERPLLLSVGRLTTRKGMIPFVRDVLPALVKEKPDICLLIVGDTPKDALAAQAETPLAILATARAAQVEDNVRWLGPRFGSALAAAYFSADVHVFPVQEMLDDPEGFGMVAIEAAAHGLPTVAYATGGVTDAVGHRISGRLIDPGDTEGFARTVLELLDKPLPTEKMHSFAASFAWDKFGAQLREALELC